MVYSIIRKRQVFYQLANLGTSDEDIRAVLSKHGGLTPRRIEAPSDTEDEEEGDDDVFEGGSGTDGKSLDREDKEAYGNTSSPSNANQIKIEEHVDGSKNSDPVVCPVLYLYSLSSTVFGVLLIATFT